MPLYESTFIIRQDVSTQEVDKISDNLAKIVANFGGKILKKESWGLLNLAYKIKKNRKGHYVMFGIEGDEATMAELGRQYKLNEDVIRSLTLRVEEITQDPSPFYASNNDNARKDEE